MKENPDALTKWQCSVAGAIKGNLQGRTDILVTTGGASYVDTSVQEAYFSCAALDVIAIHAYGLSDLTQTKLKPIVQRAQNAGKKLMMQEWGMCYFDTSNNNCPPGNALSAGTRDANIKKYADEISKSGIPWMYWQIIPNADPHNDYDFEVGGAWWSCERQTNLLTGFCFRSVSTRRTGAPSRRLLRRRASILRLSTSPSGCLRLKTVSRHQEWQGLDDSFNIATWSREAAPKLSENGNTNGKATLQVQHEALT
jgi:hypothetical protein